MSKAYLLVICLTLTTFTGCIDSELEYAYDSNSEEINEDSNSDDLDSSISTKEYLEALGTHLPKENPEHYFLFSDNIPSTLVRDHGEVHSLLFDVVGGYDRYVHITYELDGNNSQPIEVLNSLGFQNGNVQSIDDVHNVRSCLSGFAAFDKWDGKNEYSICIQPNPLTDPVYDIDREMFGEDAFRYRIFHGWVHEYFHHYQRSQLFSRALAMPNDCCGLNDPVSAPAWWVEGSAGVFPDMFISQNFNNFSFTIENDLIDKHLTDGNTASQMGGSLNHDWLYENSKKALMGEESDSPCTDVGPAEEYRDEPKCDWTLMNMYLAYITSYQTIWVDLPRDMWELGFNGSFEKHVGMTTYQFYESYENFMRMGNSDDPAPEGFFPNKPLSELVDFFAEDSSQVKLWRANQDPEVEEPDESDEVVEDSWGQLTTEIPEVYFTSDIPQSQIDTLMSAYNTSSGVWGNYGPLEFWIIGTDWDAAYELDKQYCSVRAEKDSSITSDDEQYCLERSHNMTSYAENGGAGLGLYRSYHEDYSGFVLTFASKYPYPDETDYTAVAYHEYFHVYQQAHIFTKDHDERQELSGGNPYWGEGGAEYMAQLLYSRQDGVDSNYLKDRMTWKMEAKNDLQNNESIVDIPYGPRGHIAYDLGSWYVAYIINQTSEDAYLNGFYDDLNELGWEGSFVENFGISSEQMLSDFEDFLTLPIEEQLEIIP